MPRRVPSDRFDAQDLDRTFVGRTLVGVDRAAPDDDEVEDALSHLLPAEIIEVRPLYEPAMDPARPEHQLMVPATSRQNVQHVEQSDGTYQTPSGIPVLVPAFYTARPIGTVLVVVGGHEVGLALGQTAEIAG